MEEGGERERERENRKRGASSFYTRGVPLAMPSRKRERVSFYFLVQGSRRM